MLCIREKIKLNLELHYNTAFFHIGSEVGTHGNFFFGGGEQQNEYDLV